MKKITTTSILATSIFATMLFSVGIATMAQTSLAYTSSLPKQNCSAEFMLTENEVESAQQQWAKSIIAIGKAKNPKPLAMKTINELYGFNHGKVLFKPTLASQDQFRGDKQEALSYFVGGMRKEDAGFALRGFTDIRFENEAIVTNCDTAMAMGNYFFTDKLGEKIKVEYSFAYQKTASGEVKIMLHHSSLPYLPLKQS